MSKKNLCLMLAAAFLLTGCSEVSSAPAPAESAVTAQTTAADSQSAEAAPADTAAENVTETTETSAENEAAGYEFNAHLYLPILADDVPQEYWDSFHNLCDALRAGEATFECASEDAYKWATDPAVLNQLFPAAVMQIKAESGDGTPAYENGTGRISYQIPAEEYVKRQAQFEQLVAGLLNQYLEPDDDVFEKCLKLYDYMSVKYVYEDDFVEHKPDGSTYLVITTGTGQCIELGTVYAYLLMQAGVQAMEVECSSEAMAHGWTYLLLNGKGYHSDPTWGLRSEDDPLFLTYFLMTGERRADTGCPVDDLMAPLLPTYWSDAASVEFTADDTEYLFPKGAYLLSFDEENKTVRYMLDGEEHTFSYAKAE